ncbi:Protein containing a histone methylation DOT1 motif protein [Legionella santicrucis]|uniref:Histone-lysine N-methyltransferase, H3 lysine-79 specific n=1 Tax=Legionella santicrucis TaxID=45074 RepID=A0A0W0YA66_9GAMM|nr:hypothetical protein [Legionella santicrucis]KTD53508.1 Protein containing a histone methylation DOT1 motif protein [Legionella santicrucis]
MDQLIPYFVCLFFVFLVALLHLHHKKKYFQIKRWQKSLHLQEHAQIFHHLYQTSNGFILSQNARRKHDAMEYAYGEIEFFSFIALLSLINPNENTVFYDLGSGSGKAVIACGMVFPVHKSIGIELFPELYLHSCQQVEQLSAMKQYERQAEKIKFRLGDFLEANLNDATLIFINSTAFFGPTWEKLCFKIDGLPHLNTIITTSKPLSCIHFKLLKHTKVKMSWGVVSAYIHTRKNILD